MPAKRKRKSNIQKYRAKKYSAPKGSARAKVMERAAKLYKQGKIKQAAALREKQEEKERAKKSFKTKKSRFSYMSSGSRKGMTAHQWAMARVNSVLRGGKARSIDFPSKSKKKTTKKRKK